MSVATSKLRWLAMTGVILLAACSKPEITLKLDASSPERFYTSYNQLMKEIDGKDRIEFKQAVRKHFAAGLPDDGMRGFYRCLDRGGGAACEHFNAYLAREMARQQMFEMTLNTLNGKTVSEIERMAEDL